MIPLGGRKCPWPEPSANDGWKQAITRTAASLPLHDSGACPQLPLPTVSACFVPTFLPTAFWPPPLAVFLWTICHMTCLHSKPCLNVCAERTQPKTTIVVIKNVCFSKETDSTIFKVKTTVEMSRVL